MTRAERELFLAELRSALFLLEDDGVFVTTIRRAAEEITDEEMSAVFCVPRRTILDWTAGRETPLGQ